MAKNRCVSRNRVIRASAATVFDVLADPSKHPAIDGSGSVKATRPGAVARLAMGSKFGMDMKVGVPYRMTNTVVEFEADRRIGWKHVGGHVWRYLLAPSANGAVPCQPGPSAQAWSLDISRNLTRASGSPQSRRDTRQ